MDFDPFWLIVIFFFIVMPLIERMLKGKSRQPPIRRPSGRGLPDARDPRGVGDPRRRAQRLPEAWQQQPSAETRADSSTAADMVPAELWEILTGERRTGPRTPPDVDRGGVATKPPPSRTEAPWRTEPARPEAATAADTRVPDEEAAAAELLRRRRAELKHDRAVTSAKPVVVSLETEPLAEPLRHKAFHHTLDTLPPPAAPPQRASRPITPDRLRGRAQLRRAVLMHEILGPPKALDRD